MTEKPYLLWNKAEKSFYTGRNCLIELDGTVSYVSIDRDYRLQCKTVDYEIVRYTGFKDAAGKPIYEGHILQFEDDAPGVVDFFRGSWRVKTPPKYPGDDWRTALWDAVIDGFKIIGNIYQNPELIRK